MFRPLLRSPLTRPLPRPQCSPSPLLRVRQTADLPKFAPGRRLFHSTQSTKGPLLPLLLGFLKTSTALDIAGMAARVSLTFVPVILLRNLKSKREIMWVERQGHPDLANKKSAILEGMRYRTILFHALILFPVALFWLTIIASAEQTPLTGRWRLILLSPEEEDDIAAQLAGPGWFRAVTDILAQEGPPKLVPPGDWRVAWVESTLRRLESVIPILQREPELVPDWMDHGPEGIPIPPPAEYPLRPRPRYSEYLRRIAELQCARVVHPAPHAIAGPPYSLMVVDRPESANAFSYGFGPDGAGGVVVYSGFLDDVLSRNQAVDSFAEQPQEKSWLGSLFGSFFSLSPAAPSHPIPTEAQTEELAVLLAHELAHLVLAHHIETLSSTSIIWPGVVSIGTDVLRALLFPVTMLFGPFINDAIASMGKASSGEFTKLTEYCTSSIQEIEADIVSARLLAYAGFDPRRAVNFWEGRHETPETAECTRTHAERKQEYEAQSLIRRLVGPSHPLNVVRIGKLKEELHRWECERCAALERRAQEKVEVEEV